MKKHAITLLLALIISSLVLAGCTAPTEVDTTAKTLVAQTLTAMAAVTEAPQPTATPTVEPTATSTPTPEPTPEVLLPYGPGDFPVDVNPLTGLKVADPELLNRRPMLIKVANYPAIGRPHAGLSFADIVFEYYIGEGLNRFMALYYGQDATQIGPIRSGRMVDPYLTMMYGGVLGFKGADSFVYSHIVSLLGDRAITGSEYTCPAICDNGDGTVISIFADSTAFADLLEGRAIDNSRQELDGTRFDPQTPAGGADGREATISFNVLDIGQWKYDPASGKYLRWIEETDDNLDVTMIPLTDRVTGEQLAFSNVVVLFADYEEYAPTLHDIDIWGNTGGQRAVIFRDGQAFDVNWRSVDAASPIKFTDSNGDYFALKPGNTWMVIVGRYSSVEVTDGSWDIFFYLN